MTADLATTYLGLDLANPLIASSSPLTGNLESLQRLEEAGIGAVVLPSLFEEQVEHEAMELQRLAEQGAGSFPEALSGFYPQVESYHLAGDTAVELLAEAKATLSVPVVASLNGTTAGGWVRYAEQFEDAGADAVELNIFLIPTDPAVTGGDVEARYREVVSEVRERLSIPLAVKIGPYFSSTGSFARALVEAGADALVLFNRFYQPDIDLEDMRVVPNLHLSSSDELRLPLRWVAVLRNDLDCDLAITSGVHSADDALKSVAVGANAVMMASALLRMGPGHVTAVLDGMRAWLEEHDYESVNQLHGSMSMTSAPDADAFVRANYMDMLINYTGS